MVIEIHIGNELCDFDQDVACGFSPGDVKDIQSGSMQSSYEIELPLTPTNRRLLKYNSELNVFEEPTSQARIFFDGIEILRGKVVILKTIFKKTATIIVQGSLWVDNIKGKKMRDLDLSDYNHILSTTEVENSWSGSGNPYRYGLINFGKLFNENDNWMPQDFVPMFRLVDIVQKIFYPWTVAGTWITKFTEDYILGMESKAPDEFIKLKGLSVTPSSDDLQVTSIGAGLSTYVVKTCNPVILNVESLDEGANFSLNAYTVPVTGTYRFKFACKTRCYDGAGFLTYSYQEITVELQADGGTLESFSATYSGNSIENLVTNLDTGWVYMTAGTVITGYAHMRVYATNPDSSSHSCNLGVSSGTTKLENTWDKRNLYPGLSFPIVAKNYMPDIEQQVFLKGLKDAYNLKFYADLLNQTIYIETGDDFRTNYTKSIITNEYSSYLLTDSESLTVDSESLLTSTIVTSQRAISQGSIIDFTNDIEADNVSSNYFKNTILKFKRDTQDYATDNYLLDHSEPGKTVTLSSVFAKTGNETWENSLFAYTVEKGISNHPYVPSGIPAIFGKEELGTDYEPLYRATNFVPRLFRWTGLTALNWTFNSVAKTTYPKVTPLDYSDLFSTCWIKTFHLIDRGKVITIDVVPDIKILQQFITVINDQEKEGFRPVYQFLLGNEIYGGYLNNIQFNSNKARVELIMKQ